VVGAVLEAQGFHPARTGRRHLLACAAAIGVPDAAVDVGLGAVGLLDAADRAVGGYSLGMKQRLALAVAMLGEPQVLILDEPGNGLDPEGIAWMRSFLRGFATRGGTVLVSSHLLGEIEQTADHLVVVNRGRCVYQGGLDALRASRRARVLVRCADPGGLARALTAAGVREIDMLPDGRLGVADADEVRVGDAALAAGVAVYGLVAETIDLEQLFFQLTAGAWRA
jgi:ABC-2 type transport system ATP-binding protein